jgi:predicted transport protein
MGSDQGGAAVGYGIELAACLGPEDSWRSSLGPGYELQRHKLRGGMPLFGIDKTKLTPAAQGNIVCVEVQKVRLLMHLKLDPKTFPSLPDIGRDVTDIGHYGTGDLELSIGLGKDLEKARPLIELTY